MKNCRLSSEISYNDAYISPITESSLKGYFVCYAKRNAKSLFFLRRNAYYALRRNVVDSAFLQTDRSEEAFARVCSLSPKKPRLSSFRTHSGSDVCHNHGASAHKQNRNPEIQRGVSGNAGTHSLPGAIYPSSVLEAAYSSNNSPAGETARQFESLSFPASLRNEPHLPSTWTRL